MKSNDSALDGGGNLSASPRQTQTYLRGLFFRAGIAPRHALGQNFLIDLNILDLIVETAAIGADDLVLEVGTGAGALSTMLAERAGGLIAVEVDPAMARLATAALKNESAARVIEADILKNKNTINPIVVEAIKARLAESPALKLKLTANLPYHIATPLIINLLVHQELELESATVTIQRELAERLAAVAGSSAYGSASVIVRALAEIEIVRILPPSVFWPRPKVESAVVSIRSNPAKRSRLEASGGIERFHTIVRELFLHRRKSLRGVLARPSAALAASFPEGEARLRAAGIDGMRRAETLSVDEFLALVS
jgi:16S rRNA (adenine1518-N6/adenine1519-N6)-dimethyltransferase